MEDLNPIFERNINPVLKVDDGVSKYFKNLTTEKAVERKEKLLYLMFENDQNNCWVDAAIVLIANSKAFEDEVEEFSSSKIRNIIITYKKAQAILNDSNGLIQERMDKTRKMLQSIQNSTLDYLKQFLKFKCGQPESAFCALLNLIYHDESKIKDNMNVRWIWQKNCESCGFSKSDFEKPIITLPKVNEFNPESPTCVYTCSSCKKEQEMKLIYKELPNCLIFHFEKGAGTGNNIPLSFRADAREYHLTSVIVLERSRYPYINVNHFVTWIRQPLVDMWMDCNDLNTNIVQYGRKQPEWDLNDLYMCVYEANDNLGKISYVLADSGQTRAVDAEVICLSDEGEDTQSETTIDNQNEETSLNTYSNNGVEQSKNDFYKELTGNNDEQSAFLTVSSQEVSEIEEDQLKRIDLETINIIHQNVSLTDDQPALSEMSPDVSYETGIGSENCESGSVYLTAPEIHSENIASNALNQKSEFPCMSEDDDKLGAVPRNKTNKLAEKSKQKTEDKEEANRNSNLDKKETSSRPKFGEASGRLPRQTPKLSGANARQRRQRPKLSESSARELESIIDNVTTNIFSNFMAFICEEHEKKNS